MQHAAEEVRQEDSEDDEDPHQYYCRGDVPDDWLTCTPTVPLLSPANDRSDVISEGDPVGQTLSYNEEEWFDHNAAVEFNGILHPSENSVADTGLEVGGVPTSSEPDDGINSTDVPSAKRPVKPVIRLSYDELGEPTDKPLVIMHRGMRIYITRDIE